MKQHEGITRSVVNLNVRGTGTGGIANRQGSRSHKRAHSPCNSPASGSGRDNDNGSNWQERKIRVSRLIARYVSPSNRCIGVPEWDNSLPPDWCRRATKFLRHHATHQTVTSVCRTNLPV